MKNHDPNELEVVALRECPVQEAVLTRVEPHPASRLLKIEADGDAWKGRIKPKIRLTGLWLERAGFSPGSRVRVTCVAPGIVELRAYDTSLDKPQPSTESSDGPL